MTKNKRRDSIPFFLLQAVDPKEVIIGQLQAYLKDTRTEEGLLIKLVEEVGEVAEVLNGRLKRGCSVLK